MNKELQERVARALCYERAAPACDCHSKGQCQAPLDNLISIHNETKYQTNEAIIAVIEFLIDKFSAPIPDTHSFNKDGYRQEYLVPRCVISYLKSLKDE